ncbi:E3 ubiquitin-protein ligase MIB2-like isoform X1 [Octopus vulgaris]|uniref:E3 ubiquitin-protein ligase MIB2-like isoform X1 n=1 Tax=Octopus vulgaris TaxID=6645 RepID=A0AA36HHK5_OCTVU|nr:E3 ubiquitin-protein ligase MIB2-like isoform X1 [Octopus vulgaris]
MEDNHKMTPFLQAVEWGHLGIIKKLLAKGAKVNAVNDEGNNCLHLALQNDAFHSEEEHIALLDKCAFKLSLTQGNRTCSTVVATYLFHFGANFYHPNRKNVIPLDLIQDTNLKEKLKTFLPPPCTYCQVMYASSDFKPCEHIALCRDCYIRIKGESCPTCHQPISGVREFEAPKFEDRCVQTEAICQELGAASQAIESPKSEDKCVQTEVASEEIGFQKLDERYLLKLACQLGGNWWKVGIFLGIKSIQLGIIRHDFLVMFKSRASRCCSTGQHIVIRGSYGGYIEGSSCGS